VVSGILELRVDGQQVRLKGDFTYNLGGRSHQGEAGPDGSVGFVSQHLVPYIEGEVWDDPELDVLSLRSVRGGTATVRLENGKTLSYQGLHGAGEWDVNGSQGGISMRFEASAAAEVR